MKSAPPAKLRMLPPLVALNALTALSPPPVRNSVFVPMKNSRVTCLPWALIVRACSPFSKSQTLTVLSPPAEARSFPSPYQPTSRT